MRNANAKRETRNKKQGQRNEELELELIQTQMTQKPMLRAEVYARALRTSRNRKNYSVHENILKPDLSRFCVCFCIEESAPLFSLLGTPRQENVKVRFYTLKGRCQTKNIIVTFCSLCWSAGVVCDL